MQEPESNVTRSRRRRRAEADIRVLLESWRGLRVGGEDVPQWNRFDPVLCFPHLVGHLFVLALEPSGSWRIRLVGSSLRGDLARAAGKLLEDAYPSYVTDVLQPRLDRIVTTRQPMQANHALQYQRTLHTLAILLPFHQGDFLIKRIAAAIFYLDEFHPEGRLQGFSSDIERVAHDLVD